MIPQILLKRIVKTSIIVDNITGYSSGKGGLIKR